MQWIFLNFALSVKAERRKYCSGSGNAVRGNVAVLFLFE